MKTALAKEIALSALTIGAIKLNPENPFTWASGYRMPIYNDNRMFLESWEYRSQIEIGFQYIIQRENIPYDCIAGTATAGIPHATSLANRLKCQMCYIRSKPKEHGLRNQIEGIDSDKDLAGKNVIVIEDLISTGGSSAKAVQAVRDAHGNVSYCLSIFSYGLDKADEAFNVLDPKCNVRSLLTYDVLLQTAKKIGYINDKRIALLKEWRQDPFGWGEKHGFPKIEKG